jgi:hypothetical protein
MTGPAGTQDLEIGAIQGRTVFSTPLYLLVLPAMEDANAAIAAEVLKHRAASNRAGAWRSPWSFPPIEWEPLSPIADAARLLATRLARGSDAQGPLGAPSWRLSCRATVLAGGQGVEVETTPRADFAATYLVNDGDAGRDPTLGGLLELQDPRGPAPVMYAPDLIFAAPGAETLGVTQTAHLTPGALALYPAWMMHSLSFYSGETPHISLTLALSLRREA